MLHRHTKRARTTESMCQTHNFQDYTRFLIRLQGLRGKEVDDDGLHVSGFVDALLLLVLAQVLLVRGVHHAVHAHVGEQQGRASIAERKNARQSEL